MKFGTGYSYWGNEWACDYIAVTNKVADIGFDVLEIGADHLYNMSSEEIEALRVEGEKRNIEFIANSGPQKAYDFASPDSKVRENALTYFTEILYRMKKLNIKVLVGAIYSFWPTDFLNIDKEAAWERSIDGLKKLSRVAAELDVECALEVLNRNETYILTDCREALEYIKRIDSKNISILLDTYHMNIEEDNMYDAIRSAGDKLGHLHVGECNRKLPGMNNSIDWINVGRALQDIHYDKAVVMEPFLLTGGAVGRDIRVWRDLSNNADEATLDIYIRDSLKYLKRCFTN